MDKRLLQQYLIKSGLPADQGNQGNQGISGNRKVSASGKIRENMVKYRKIRENQGILSEPLPNF